MAVDYTRRFCRMFNINGSLLLKISLLLLFVSIKIVVTEEIVSNSNEPVNNDHALFNRSSTSSSDLAPDSSLATWFRTALELDASFEVSKSKRREKPPVYVQELYEMVTDDEYVEKRFDRIGDESLTIQAIHQDSTTLENNGVAVRFPLKKLWVKAERMARAELVLAVRRDALLPNVAYTVSAASFAEGDFGLRPLLVFSQRLPVAERAADRHAFQSNFIVFQFADVVRDCLSSRDTTRLVVRLSVTEKIDNEDDDDGDSTTMENRRFLRAADVRRLFHLNSRGRVRPLLVLYSRQMDSPLSPLRRRRHRRDANGDDADDTYVDASTHHASVGNCALHKWRVDLNALLGGSVVRPAKASINFCSGKCPYPIFDAYWNATNNAVIRNTYVATGQNSRRRVASSVAPNDDDGGVAAAAAVVVPDAVCVPRTYDPLTILYEENGSYVIKNWKEVAATSCSCA